VVKTKAHFNKCASAYSPIRLFFAVPDVSASVANHYRGFFLSGQNMKPTPHQVEKLVDWMSAVVAGAAIGLLLAAFV